MTTKKQYRYSLAINDLQGGYSVRMLRKAETELIAKVFKHAGFRTTDAIAHLKNRWDIIYKALLHSDESLITSPTRGKAMKSLGLPQYVTDILQKNHISIRQWSNATGLNENTVVETMLSMDRLEETDTYITNYIGRDFPALSKMPTNNIIMPPQIYIRGDVVIRQGYGKDRIAIAKMDTGIEVKGAGESTEEAMYVVKAKAKTITRLFSLYHYIYGSFPTLKDLIEPVDEPYFAIPEDIKKYRAESNSGYSSDFGTYIRANQ